MYSSPADVRFALTPGGDENDQTTASSFEDAQLNDAIKEADGHIDTYLSAFFQVPQDPDLPDVAVYPVRAWSRDIAAYLATLTYRKSSDLDPDDPIRLRFRFVMDVLEKIADGKLKPNLPPVDPGNDTAQGAFVYNINNFRLFDWSDMWPTRPWSYVQQHRYGDLLLTGSGYNEVLVLIEGQAIPPGTANDTLVVFIPEGS